MSVEGSKLAGQSMPEEQELKIQTKHYEVVHAWPHDCEAFTEGLEFFNGVLYESTGGDKDTPDIGLSSLRRVDLNTGKVLQELPIDKDYFAEGLTIFGHKIFQLTYRSHKGFIYDLKSFKPQGEFPYTDEGWGLTSDNTNLIMSDGTSIIRFLDPVSFKVVHTIPLTEGKHPLERLNELEYA